ncbi:hypothetical protein GCM10011586_13170 [Silvibacterium dinghuense]|nr:hypothetical protein GCM10011586_13170 [Silvibacterium dinghuense]
MKELRFKVEPGLAGSAARAAEQEKRAAAPISTQRPGFSLRAQGGRVVRTDKDHTPTPETPLRDARSETSKEQIRAVPQAETPLNSSWAAEERGGSPNPPSAGLLQGFTDRLKTLFRGTGSSE